MYHAKSLVLGCCHETEVEEEGGSEANKKKKDEDERYASFYNAIGEIMGSIHLFCE